MGGFVGQEASVGVSVGEWLQLTPFRRACGLFLQAGSWHSPQGPKRVAVGLGKPPFEAFQVRFGAGVQISWVQVREPSLKVCLEASLCGVANFLVASGGKADILKLETFMNVPALHKLSTPPHSNQPT